MSLYEILGVDKSATATQIRSAYRRLAKTCHPDQNGGDAEATARFHKLKDAFEVLSDEDRRKRYDTTGRSDVSRVTDKAIKDFIENMMTSCVEAQLGNGEDPPDPAWDNTRERILLSMQKTRVEIKDKRFAVDRKIRRVKELLARFKPNKDAPDLVGDALRKNLARLQSEGHTLDDVMGLNKEAEKVFLTYGYQVGPQSEGQGNQGPTTRRSGVQFLSLSDVADMRRGE